MGKKKGKGKGQEEKWAGEDQGPSLLDEVRAGEGAAVESPVAQGGGKGKKGKKAKKTFDDWGGDLEAIAAESGMTVGGGEEEEEGKPKGQGEEGRDDLGEPTAPVGGKKDKDREDDVTMETGQHVSAEEGKPTTDAKDKRVSEASADTGQAGGGAKESPAGKGAAGGKKGKKNKKKGEEWEEDIDALVREMEGTEPITKEPQASPADEMVESKPGAEAGVKEEEPEAESHTVMTAAQKKAAKKERKKEAAKKAKLQSSEKGKEADTLPDDTKPTTEEVKDQSVKEKDQSTLGTSTEVEPLATLEGAVGGEEEGEGEGEEEEGDKKKKKKKKKKPEEEKKPKAKKGPGKLAIQKMKEQVEALRLEQKRREEEELARIRAEEEAEKRRLEQLRLEEERKEKKRQKEKEKRQRKREEGKPVTKAEREKHAKAMAQLKALEAQGIVVPARGESSEKKKVLYGSRQRSKKPKSQAAALEVDQVHDEATSVTSEVASSVGDVEEAVKGSWEDEEGEEDTKVKDTWDEESEGEEDMPTRTMAQPETRPEPAAAAKEAKPQASVDSEEEEEESSESSSESSEESDTEELTPYDKAARRIQARQKRHREERSLDYLRSPVICVLGHVDTGKTKILDKIRRSNVQDGEAGGITQQIGATFVPEAAVREQTKMVKEFAKTEVKVPGLLIIDTPGHESFNNLRVRGSSMCDLAVLVVDVMHGLEPQTIESLEILRKGKTPFVIALNKIDRLFDWRRNPNSGIRETLKKQKVNTKEEMDERVKGVITEFAEQGLNVAMFWEKVNFREYVPMVPTSAITGDGMGDLIAMLVNYSQRMLIDQLMLSQELEALVLEVKVIPGLGTTIDVILRDGIIQEGDTLILTGTEGPFVTQIRALLMPQPLRELRVKSAYVNHKAIIASQGVKITGKDLERCLAGTPVLVAKKPDEIDVLKDEATAAFKSTLNAIELQERGVFVQASTLGSLEALLGFLKHSKIPYAGVNIGPVHKKDVMKASVMLEHDVQWAVILAFDVRVEREAQEMADSLGVRIFSADIIYHLFDNFIKHRQEERDRKRREFAAVAVFPCKLRILPNCVFNSRDPIVVGVVVEGGQCKPGMPLTIPSKNFLDIGVISSLELNHKPVEVAHKGDEVCIKVEAVGGDAPKLYGRHFDYTDPLVSKISRESIDAVKNYFREDLSKSDWQLMIELKKVFHII